MPISRDRVRHLMGVVAANQGHTMPLDDDTTLRDFGFRSLDFSELVLRVEDDLGVELNFEAITQRQVLTIADVLDMIEAMAKEV